MYNKNHYFDYNATTPMDPPVWEAQKPFATEHFVNASSLYSLTRPVKQLLRQTRRELADFLGAQETEMIFTSGGTESNNAAIRGALAAQPDKREIITSSIEHSSVLKLCKRLEEEGCTVHRIGVNSQGLLSLDQLEAALSDRVAVASFMYANNETGTLLQMNEIARRVKAHGIRLHVDAVQAVGKRPVKVHEIGCDYLSLSAHKFYGPKGMGALYVRKGAPFVPLIFGGSQEMNRRASTENIPAAAGLGAAVRLVQDSMQQEADRLTALKASFETQMKQTLTGIQIVGENTDRLCNTSLILFDGVLAETLLIALDQNQIYASSGSACMSGSNEPSHVLKAMGFSDAEAKSAVRFSFGKWNLQADVEKLIDTVSQIVNRLRAKQSKLSMQEA